MSTLYVFSGLPSCHRLCGDRLIAQERLVYISIVDLWLAIPMNEIISKMTRKTRTVAEAEVSFCILRFKRPFSRSQPERGRDIGLCPPAASYLYNTPPAGSVAGTRKICRRVRSSFRIEVLMMTQLPLCFCLVMTSFLKNFPSGSEPGRFLPMILGSWDAHIVAVMS